MRTRSFYCAVCQRMIRHEVEEDDVMEGIAAAEEHFRVLHPDLHEAMERWPDGAPVVVDETLDPEDFS